jgi:hypothetical protein
MLANFIVFDLHGMQPLIRQVKTLALRALAHVRNAVSDS